LSPSLVIITNNTGHFWGDLWFVSDGELIFSQPNVFLPVLTNSAGLHAEVSKNMVKVLTMPLSKTAKLRLLGKQVPQFTTAIGVRPDVIDCHR
jgi:hypothetical protein